MLSYQITSLRIAGPKEHLDEPDLSRNKMGRVVLTYIDADFEFWQANECLFREPDWNVGDFATQLATWLKSGLAADFRFDCIDSECRNLFTFQHSGSNFKFLSEWSEFSEIRAVERAELIAFIREFTAEVSRRIKSELGLDANTYLRE